MIPCEVYLAIARILQVYVLVMLVYALVSWVPSLRGKWTEYVSMLVEPVLTPVRRIIPPIAGLDLSFLVVIFLIQAVIRLATQYAYSCSF
jgi:YggT family protein